MNHPLACQDMSEARMYVLDKAMLSVCLQSDRSYGRLMISPEQSEFSESGLLAPS